MTRTTWKDHEPEFNPIDYKGSMIANLKFYNSEVEDDLKKDWTLSYWKAQGKSTAYMDKVHPASFAQLGVLVRIMERGYGIEDNHQKFIDDEYLRIAARVRKPKDETKVVEKISTEDKVEKAAADLMCDIDAEFDQISEHGTRKYDLNKHLDRSKLLLAISDILLKRYQPKLEELKIALDGSDKQIKEGYSQYSKKNLRMLCDFAESIVKTCESATPVVRTRKSKPVSISKMVSKVVYLKEYPALQLKSVNLESLVGAKVIYLFNVKVRKLIRYEVADGEKLTVKGTTLIGYDEKKSFGKTIRKPEVFFQGINSMAQRAMDKKCFDVAGVNANVSGRINGDMIILKVF